MSRKSRSIKKKDLKRLKRSELLEIMLVQSEEIDRLRAELKEKNAELARRDIALKNSGSIAEASLALSGVFDDAQKAADIYVENVKEQAAQQVRVAQQTEQARQQAVAAQQAEQARRQVAYGDMPVQQAQAQPPQQAQPAQPQRSTYIPAHAAPSGTSENL